VNGLGAASGPYTPLDLTPLSPIDAVRPTAARRRHSRCLAQDSLPSWWRSVAISPTREEASGQQAGANTTQVAGEACMHGSLRIRLQAKHGADAAGVLHRLHWRVRYGVELQEGGAAVLVQAHDGALVAHLVAVVGRAKHGDQLAVVDVLVALCSGWEAEQRQRLSLSCASGQQRMHACMMGHRVAPASGRTLHDLVAADDEAEAVGLQELRRDVGAKRLPHTALGGPAACKGLRV